MSLLKKVLALVIVYLVFAGITWEWNPQTWKWCYVFIFSLFELFILIFITEQLVIDVNQPTDHQDDQGT